MGEEGILWEKLVHRGKNASNRKLMPGPNQQTRRSLKYFLGKKFCLQ